MRFELRHPHDPTIRIAYGFDHALPGGFFAVVDLGECPSPPTGNRALIEYDALQEGYSEEFPLRGCVEFLVEHDVFSMDDLNEAIVWFEQHGDRSPPKRLRVAVTVIANMKQAAD